MNTITKIMTALKEGVPLNNDYKQIVAGRESKDPIVNGVVAASENTLLTNIENILTDPSVNKSLGYGVENASHIDAARVEAAKAVAIYAMEPLKSSVSLTTRAGIEANTTFNTTVFEPNSTSTDSIIAGIESFDSQKLNIDASAYYSMAFNAVAITQDPVVELFFPVFVSDPKSAGFVVTANISSIMSAIERRIDGTVTKYNKQSIIKNLQNTELFTLEANRLYPIYRPESKNKLVIVDGVDGLTEEVIVGAGSTETTAFIKTNTEVDLLGISQPTDLLTKGVMDQTDVLNSYLVLDKILIKITGKDASDTTITEYFIKELAGLPATFFGGQMSSGDNDSKDMKLDYTTKSIVIKGGAFTQADGSVSKLTSVLGIADGYSAKLKIKLNGEANIETGKYIVYTIAVELLDVLDLTGRPVAKTSSSYVAAAEAVSGLTVVGTMPKAYANNDNGRIRSRKLTTTRKTYGYTIQTRFTIREEYSVNKTNNTDGDADSAGLVSQILFTQQTMNKFGLLELFDGASKLDNSAIDMTEMGISDDLFNKSSIKDTIDLSVIVDSVESTKRASDITAALELQVSNIAATLSDESGYRTAFLSQYPGKKPTVAIGIDTSLGIYLKDFSDSVYNYVVAVSSDVLMRGKMVVGFTVMDENRNKKPNIFSYGTCAWSPEVVIAGTRSGETYVSETMIAPRFRHQTLQPILGVFEVIGLEDVYGKVKAYRVNK